MTETLPPRDRLAAALGGLASPGSFSAQRVAPADALSLEVKGFGKLTLPLSPADAQKLCELGRAARYGRGEQTLLDRQVRDTWEIPKSRVRIDKRGFDKTLVPMLERLRGDLGLPAGCELEAELHSMLVYAPGQFFVPHQDSEKTDTMIGSLIVTLPGSFKGGTLEVHQGGEVAVYRGSKTSLSFVAFYADCRHQIRRVSSGHRVVLTYNLLLRRETELASADVAPADLAVIAGCLDDHFNNPLHSARGPVGDTPAPDRLVYLLEHEYTQRGLGWSRLKGSDTRRAAALVEAAALADCDVVLALADVHETWSCSEDPWDRGRRGRSGYRRSYGRDDSDGDLDDEDPWSEARGSDDPDLDDYELDELLDWSTTLVSWSDGSGKPAEPISSSVDDAEVSASTPSAQLRPYASEYEGYMGNYGNTVDRWYHRGAVLLWPRERTFVVRAEVSPAGALDALRATMRRGDLTTARHMATALAPFWNKVAREAVGPRFFTKALGVAGKLEEPATASMLLKPFAVERLTPSHARPLAALVEGYGEPWARDLLTAWSRGDAPGASYQRTDRPAWLASLPRLCAALDNAGPSGIAAARLVVDDCWNWLRAAVEHRRAIGGPSRRDEGLAELAKPILAFLESTTVIDAPDLRQEATHVLCDGSDDLLGVVTAVLRAGEGRPATARAAAGLPAIAQYCSGRLEMRLARPPRDPDDWSIEAPRGCPCSLCGTLHEFLTDPDRRVVEWPLAQDGRRHVHSTIDAAELPVRHETRRAGRPYTLVLTKTEALFEHDQKSLRRDEADLVMARRLGGDAKNDVARIVK